MKTKFLIVVDMQNDFVTGSLGSQEAQGIVSNVVKRIENARENGWSIYATQDTHYDDYLETQEGKKLPVPHCVIGTEGWELAPAVADCLEKEPFMCYEKNTFGSVNLAEDLAEIIHTGDFDEPECEIELIGLCTDICVVSNALLLKAYLPEANISVNASCCAGTTEEKHSAALETLRSCQVHVLWELL